ncbi:hypothetical protein [Ekhidna sp.]
MKNIEDIVDQALKTEPSFQLGTDFKDRVIKAVRNRERVSQKRLYLWMTLGIVIMFGFGYATFAYFLPSALENLKGVQNLTNQVVPMAVLIGVLITIIQVLDSRLIKNKKLHL